MSFECSECFHLVEGEKPPFICPCCGLAGVQFCAVDDPVVTLEEYDIEILFDETPEEAVESPRFHTAQDQAHP